MKKSLIVSWICAVMLCCKVFSQTANDYVASGLGNLANQDLVNANSNFLAALTLDTNNADANVLLAATRLLLAPQTPAGSNFLNGLNFPANGRDVYNWTSAPPKDALGGPAFLPNYNSTNVVYFYRTNIMLLVNASLINLGNVTDTSFLLTITNGDGLGQVTIDYGDVQMFRALLTAGNFLGYTLDANNASFILPQIVGFADTNGLTLQRILSTYPSLLTPHNTNDLIPSENALESAAAFYFTASDFIRNDRSPDDTNDLITLGPDEAGSEANFRTGLSNVVSSLTVPTQFDPNDSDSIVNLGPYFSGKTSVRKFAPQFNGNAYVNNTLPDYTFGGILPDEPPYKTEAFLRQSFGSPAGFYVGNVQDDSFGDPNAGIFEVFVGANNQIDIVGYDSDAAGGAAPGGFLVQATVDAHGDWQVSNSSVNGSGHVGQHGGFSGELDYANGDSIELVNSMEILPPGPFQGPSGYYTGTASSSGHSASLAGILAPDGSFIFREVDSSGTSSGGGFSQFDSSDDMFSALAYPDTSVSGTLNPSAAKITGNFNSPGGGSGTFTMSRSANLSLDVPPTITSDLPASVTIPLGNVLKLTLGASGSAPLDFQWYVNSTEDPPIPGATSSTLIVSNNILQHTGQYTIWATVNNVAGETNSQNCLVTVVAETNTPTITITSPKPGQLWSNDTFNVTGTTSDKVGITGVFYYINNGFFAGAQSSDNWAHWTVPNLPLVPGTNTIVVYAYNVGGIAATNSVKLIYIESGALTTITNGMGSITPYNSGTLLQISKSYSLTAKGTDGFKFVNWTGGTNQPFSVYTNSPTVQFVMSNNLTMQANFTDTNKPFLSITNVKSGMLWSNASFTVMGRATDNVAVASVQYSFNSADFTPALTNGGSWSAGVTLLPGTNTFNVYALDTSGNASAVSSVKIVYILSGILTVQTNGVGSISPNDNGDMLQIGKNYTLTATARDGFTFTNWTGSTNGTFIVLTNKPMLTFTMVSNLVLVANLIDTSKPFISVTNAKTGMLWSNSAFTVQGRATDNVAVASVNYSLNGAPYTTAGLGVGSWSAGVTLVAGTNTFSAYAVDTVGNISATDTVKVVYIVSGILKVQTNGVGSISPNDNGAWLQIGKNYMLTATARDGFTFTNWTGSTNGTFIVLTNKPTLNFTMVSNLVLVANFVDTTKPFVSITNVTSGKQMTNMAFTVMGVATDNVAVASVNYSLDGDAYTTASLIGRSWSAGIEMTPGTNKFSVYAVDNAGNVSPTNTIIIIRVPTVTTFLIATNLGITQPFARIAFDGTNYLAVFVGTNGVLGQFVSQTGTLIGGPLTLGPGITEDQPSVEFDGTNYLVVWKELNDQTGGGPAKGVFVTPAGEVSDQITLSQSTSLFNIGTVAFGGGVYFLMWSDNITSPTSVYGAMIDRSGTNVSGDFLISSDASSDETAQNSAAFDGTNFLAVWYPGNANDNLSIQGQLIDTSGNLVGSPFVIYTNSVPTGTAPPQVVFDGSKFLVLFDIGINSTKSSAYHVIGRFVTTSGGVLTNQVNLTSDAGPQIVGSSDFDGFNYLMAWNQGLNLSTVTSSSTINGRFFDPNGMPVSVEFPIFKTSGSRIPTWSPVLFDGTRFVLAAGLAKEVNALTFTNGVIYGAFVSP